MRCSMDHFGAWFDTRKRVGGNQGWLHEIIVSPEVRADILLLNPPSAIRFW